MDRNDTRSETRRCAESAAQTIYCRTKMHHQRPLNSEEREKVAKACFKIDWVLSVHNLYFKEKQVYPLYRWIFMEHLALLHGETKRPRPDIDVAQQDSGGIP